MFRPYKLYDLCVNGQFLFDQGNRIEACGITRVAFCSRYLLLAVGCSKYVIYVIGLLTATLHTRSKFDSVNNVPTYSFWQWRSSCISCWHQAVGFILIACLLVKEEKYAAYVLLIIVPNWLSMLNLLCMYICMYKFTRLTFPDGSVGGVSSLRWAPDGMTLAVVSKYPPCI